MFGRYRSYTSYSEENGKLVPSKEPDEKDVKFKMSDKLVLVPLEAGKKKLKYESEKKLKYESDTKEITSLPSKMTSSLSDMSKLLKTLKATQEDFQCLNCKQYYKRKWCNSDDKPCYFCKLYLPMKDTIYSILRDIDWRYLKSGETSRREFYNEFLDNLAKWTNHYHVFSTKQDLKTIEELRSVQDWTRNEPDYDYYY